jgi:hypothetical protein
MTNTINGTRQLGDWEHQKFREDSTGRPAIAVVNADGSNVGGSGGLTDTQLRAAPIEVTGTVSTTAPEGGATEEYQETQTDILNGIQTAVQSIASAKGISGDIRVTILSGTVTTVTTVTTLSNQTSMGGWTASSIVPATSNTTAVLSNINNVSL